MTAFSNSNFGLSLSSYLIFRIHVSHHPAYSQYGLMLKIQEITSSAIHTAFEPTEPRKQIFIWMVVMYIFEMNVNRNNRQNIQYIFSILFSTVRHITKVSWEHTFAGRADNRLDLCNLTLCLVVFLSFFCFGSANAVGFLIWALFLDGFAVYIYFCFSFFEDIINGGKLRLRSSIIKMCHRWVVHAFFVTYQQLKDIWS